MKKILTVLCVMVIAFMLTACGSKTGTYKLVEMIGASGEKVDSKMIEQFGMTMELVWFSLAFVIIGCISKIIGCSGVSKLLGFNWRESLQIGSGMMVRGEVALIVATKGLSSGLFDSKYFTSVILLIIVSSMLVPIMLKKLFSEKDSDTSKDNLIVQN